VTSYFARTALASPGTRRTRDSDWGLAVSVAGFGAISAPYGLPILGDAAFEVLLFILVVSRFYRFIGGRDAQERAALTEFSRRSCRTVYSMLYGAMLLRLSCRMLSISWNGEDMTLGWSTSFHADPQNLVIECGEGFRGHLLCGVIALLLVRGLCAYQHRRLPPPRADRCTPLD
jgi:hypothetical protein